MRRNLKEDSRGKKQKSVRKFWGDFCLCAGHKSGKKTSVTAVMSLRRATKEEQLTSMHAHT